MKIYCTYDATISDGTPNITGHYNSEVNAELFDIVEQVEEVEDGEDIVTTSITPKVDSVLADAILITEEQWQLSTQELLYIDSDSTPQEYIPPEKTEQELYEEELASTLSKRKARYRTESDPIKIEAEYDAIEAGTSPDYTEWVAKVQQIKAELPLPEEV